MAETTQDARMQKRQEICLLRSQLSSPASDIGDWKVAKIYEARIKGESDPYDAADLIEKRQAVRDRIAALEKELGEESTPTDEEKKAQAINQLDTGYARDKETILRTYTGALIAGDTTLQASLKEELTALDAQYDADMKAVKGE